MTKAAISDRIREARRAAKLTQDQLAERLGISSQAVQQWESGRAKPDLDRLPAVARVLNVADAWLAWGMGLPERTANDTLLALSNARGGGYLCQASTTPLLRKIFAKPLMPRLRRHLFISHARKRHFVSSFGIARTPRASSQETASLSTRRRAQLPAIWFLPRQG